MSHGLTFFNQKEQIQLCWQPAAVHSPRLVFLERVLSKKSVKPFLLSVVFTEHFTIITRLLGSAGMQKLLYAYKVLSRTAKLLQEKNSLSNPSGSLGYFFPLGVDLCVEPYFHCCIICSLRSSVVWHTLLRLFAFFPWIWIWTRLASPQSCLLTLRQSFVCPGCLSNSCFKYSSCDQSGRLC